MTDKVQGCDADHQQLNKPSPMQQRFEEVLNQHKPKLASAFSVDFDYYEFTEEGVIQLTTEVAEAFVRYKQALPKEKSN